MSDPNTHSCAWWLQEFRIQTKVIAVKVLSQDTIANVKSYIEAKEGIAAEKQSFKLVTPALGVMTLADDRTLADYNLHDGLTRIWLKVDSKSRSA